MSYIVARVVEQGYPDNAEHGFTVPEIDFRERELNMLDMDMDSDQLDFILGLIRQVNDLCEGEALVVWKEIF